MGVGEHVEDGKGAEDVELVEVAEEKEGVGFGRGGGGVVAFWAGGFGSGGCSGEEGCEEGEGIDEVHREETPHFGWISVSRLLNG